MHNLLTLLFFVLVSTISASAFAGEIQMLPPVTFDGTDKTPCSGAQAGLLYWDGDHAIKCVPGSTGDVGGNITLQSNLHAQGEVQPGSSGAGCSAANEGAIRYDAPSHTPQYCGVVGGNYKWTTLGGAGSVDCFMAVNTSVMGTDATPIDVIIYQPVQCPVGCSAGWIVTSGTGGGTGGFGGWPPPAACSPPPGPPY